MVNNVKCLLDCTRLKKLQLSFQVVSCHQAKSVASSLCVVQQAFNIACEVLLVSDHPSLPSFPPSSVVLCHHIDTSHLRDGASMPRYSYTLKPSHPLCHHFQPLTPPHKYGLASFLNSHAPSFRQFFIVQNLGHTRLKTGCSLASFPASHARSFHSRRG